MKDLIPHILIVIVPLILSNTMHMLVVKKGLFPVLEIPIWTWGFGKNKTLRGFLLLPIMNACFTQIVFWIFSFSHLDGLMLGAILGLSYMIFELPNSFLKRRLGIKEGAQAQKGSQFFTFLDKIDSAFGVVLVYFLHGLISLFPAFLLFLIAAASHFIFSYVLYRFRIKKSL